MPMILFDSQMVSCCIRCSTVIPGDDPKMVIGVQTRDRKQKIIVLCQPCVDEVQQGVQR